MNIRQYVTHRITYKHRAPAGVKGFLSDVKVCTPIRCTSSTRESNVFIVIQWVHLTRECLGVSCAYIAMRGTRVTPTQMISGKYSLYSALRANSSYSVRALRGLSQRSLSLINVT